MQKIAILFLGALFIAKAASADIIYLKNGGEVEGIIEKEDENKVEVNMGFGSATFDKNQVRNIKRSVPEERTKTIKKWEEESAGLELKIKESEKERERRFDNVSENWKEETRQKKLGEENEIKSIQTARDEKTKGIIVEVLLNERVKAVLTLDTGASLVILSRRIGEELGIDISDTKNDMMELRLADGKKTLAKAIVLDSIRIQDVEEKKVIAAILVEDIPDPSSKDGLLGMSFLSRFNIKMDLKSMKMTLEKLNKADK